MLLLPLTGTDTLGSSRCEEAHSTLAAVLGGALTSETLLVTFLFQLPETFFPTVSSPDVLMTSLVYRTEICCMRSSGAAPASLRPLLYLTVLVLPALRIGWHFFVTSSPSYPPLLAAIPSGCDTISIPWP